MWNIWTGFVPPGIGFTISALVIALMLILWVLGSILIWKDEREEAAEKKRLRQEKRKAELGRRKTSTRRAV